jgi:hypothetical protein
MTTLSVEKNKFSYMTIPSVEIKDLVDLPSFIIRRKGWRCIGISDLAKKKARRNPLSEESGSRLAF